MKKNIFIFTLITFLISVSTTSIKAGSPIPIPSVINGPPLSGCGIDTAIGCLPILNETNLAMYLLRWGMGIAGGIALLMIGYSSIMIMTASGDPRKLQGGKELLTAAISGLLLLVFSAFILRIAGRDIIGII